MVMLNFRILSGMISGRSGAAITALIHSCLRTKATNSIQLQSSTSSAHSWTKIATFKALQYQSIVKYSQCRSFATKQQLVIGDTGSQWHGSNQRMLWRWDILTSILIFLGVIDDLEKREDPLILQIKRGILARQRGQHQKADWHFHAALAMAQDQKYTDAETYIFDCMADNCLDRGELDKARDLYLEVVSRLGDKIQEEELVEISCKLSHCYSNTGSVDQAEIGFQFAIDTLLPSVRPFYNDREGKILVTELDAKQKNSLALLGMCYDYYSKHLESRHLRYSLAYKLKALRISALVNGAQEEQTLILHNDLANLYSQLENYDEAKKNLVIAIEGAKVTELSDLPLFYVNLASLHHRESRPDLAKQQCRKAQDFLIKYRSAYRGEQLSELMNKSDECLRGERFY